MAKTAGFPTQIQIDDSGSVARDLSNNITNFTLGTTRGEQAITGLDKSAMERLLLLADGRVTVNGPYDPAANRAHTVFSGLIAAAVQSETRITLPPATAGAPELVMNILWNDFTYTRNANGELTWQATGNLADGTVPTWGVKA